MENVELKKEQLLKLLFEGNVIGMGTTGIIKQIDSTTLAKIYYKKIMDTYLSKDPNKLDDEIEMNKEIQTIMLTECKKALDYAENEKLEQKKLQYLHEIGLVKGILFYQEFKIGLLLNYYKEYVELTKIKKNLTFTNLLSIMNSIGITLEDMMKNGLYPEDLREDNILVRPYDLDIKFIDLDDSTTRYEEISYVLNYPHIKNNCLEAYNQMKERVLYKK